MYGQERASTWFTEYVSRHHSFQSWLDQVKAKEEPQSERKSVILPADRRQLTAGQRKSLIKGLDLDLGKILLVEPGFYALDERYPYALQFEASLTQQQQMSRLAQNYCAELDLPYQLLSQEKWGPGDVQSLNDLAVLNEWLEHQQSLEGVGLVSPMHQELAALCERYGTQQVVWINVYAYTRNRVGKPLVLAAGFILPLLLPYSLYYSLTPRYDTVFFLQAYEVLDAFPKLIYPQVIGMQARPDLIKSVLYDQFRHLGTRKK